MRLTDYVSPDTVAPDLQVEDKKDLLCKMVEMIYKSGKISDPALLLKSLLDREKIMTTGIGKGIAVPHTVSPEVKEQTIALGRIPGGMDFDSLDRSPVYIVFLLVGPPQSSENHLKTLARISRLIQQTSFIESIKKAENAVDILRILAEEDEKQER